jgi:hypothetical protein
MFLKALNKQLQLISILRSAADQVLDYAPVRWENRSSEAILEEIAGLMDMLLKDDAEVAASLPRHPPASAEALDGWLTPEMLKRFQGVMAQRVKDVKKRDVMKTRVSPGAGATDAAGRSILERIAEDGKAIASLLPEASFARLAFERFEYIDQELFPVDLAAGLATKDIIETVRLSPKDAERGFSKKGHSDKVAGDALYHFAGFFKKSWRSNDILWGRLDALCQLVEVLLTTSRVRVVVRSRERREGLRKALFSDPNNPSSSFRVEYDPAVLFPSAGPITQRQLQAWLRDLVSDDARLRRGALDSHAGTLDLLIEAAQREIVRTELPSVITDALEEQAEWGQVPVVEGGTRASRSKGGEVSPSNDEHGTTLASIFEPLQVDPFIATVAAAKRMQDAMANASAGSDKAQRPAKTALGQFFAESYKVGSEKLAQDVPPMILLEIIAMSLLLVRDCVITGLGDRGRAVRKTLVYRMIIAAPLDLFYLGVRLSRFRFIDARRWWGIAAAGLMVLAIVSSATCCTLTVVHDVWLAVGEELAVLVIVVGAVQAMLNVVNVGEKSLGMKALFVVATAFYGLVAAVAIGVSLELTVTSPLLLLAALGAWALLMLIVGSYMLGTTARWSGRAQPVR